jgi:hypothetical protein
MLVVQIMDQLDLSGFHFGGVNITGFRLMSDKNERLNAYTRDWLKLNSSQWTGAGRPLDVRRQTYELSIVPHILLI